MHTAEMVAETDGGGDPKWMVYNVIFDIVCWPVLALGGYNTIIF